MDVLAERASIDNAVSGKTVCTLFADAVAKWGDRDALHWKDDGSWRSLTWRGYRDEVAAVTLALRSLGFGAVFRRVGDGLSRALARQFAGRVLRSRRGAVERWA